MAFPHLPPHFFYIVGHNFFRDGMGAQGPGGNGRNPAVGWLPPRWAAQKSPPQKRFLLGFLSVALLTTFPPFTPTGRCATFAFFDVPRGSVEMKMGSRFKWVKTLGWGWGRDVRSSSSAEVSDYLVPLMMPMRLFFPSMKKKMG